MGLAFLASLRASPQTVIGHTRCFSLAYTGYEHVLSPYEVMSESIRDGHRRDSANVTHKL